MQSPASVVGTAARSGGRAPWTDRAPGGDAVGMRGTIDHAPQRDVGDRRSGRTPAAALFWRLFLLNALVFLAGATVLVLSPATVSTPVLAHRG